VRVRTRHRREAEGTGVDAHGDMSSTIRTASDRAQTHVCEPRRMAFDPKTLFESHEPSEHDDSDADEPDPEAEIAKVAAGDKAIAMFSGARAELDELVTLALESGVMTILQPSHVPVEPDDADLFVLHAEQAWRVPALAALWETTAGRWSEAAEDQQSVLLDYTEEQRADWHAERAWREPATAGIAIYALLDAAEVAALDAVGRRIFADGTRVFFHPHLAIRRDAIDHVPRGKTLARAGLSRGVLVRSPGMVTPIVNSKLTSNVQLLTPAGWR